MDPTIQAIASYLDDSYSPSYLVSYAQELGIPDLDTTPLNQVPILIAQVLAEHGYTRATLPLITRGFFPQYEQTSAIGGQYGDTQYGGSPGQFGSDGIVGSAEAFGSTRGMLAFTDRMGYTVPELPSSQESTYEVPFLGPPMLIYADRQPPANTTRPYYRQPPLGDALSSDEGEETHEWTGNISNRFGAASSVHGLRGQVMTPYGRASSRYGTIYTTTGIPAGGGASQYGGTYGGSSSPSFNGLSPRRSPNPTSSPLKPYIPQVPPGIKIPLPRLITDLPGSNDPYIQQLRHNHNQHPWEADGQVTRQPYQVYPGSVSRGDEAARWRDVARNRATTSNGRASHGESWDSGIIAEPYIPYNGRSPQPRHSDRAPQPCGCRAKRYK
jgi:hypothetical protein